MTKVAFIFPGQGAQEVGMGKEFYASSPGAKAVFDEADQSIPGLSKVIFNGPPEKLTSTAFCQPGIFTFSVAALRALEEHPKFQSLSPQFAAGLSLGEYPALVAAGALSFADALTLVERRSSFMEEATKLHKGAMAAIIGFPREDLIKVCEETGAEVANFNSPDQIVITGAAEKVQKASGLIQRRGAKRVIPLDVSGAFHSSLMRAGADRFKDVLAQTHFQNARIPVISNVDGRPAQAPEDFQRTLKDQITSSVQWVETVNYVTGQGVNIFLEIGPGNVLKGLIRKINRDLTVYNIRKPEDIDNLPF